jgi:hypothetical protein
VGPAAQAADRARERVVELLRAREPGRTEPPRRGSGRQAGVPRVLLTAGQCGITSIGMDTFAAGFDAAARRKAQRGIPPTESPPEPGAPRPESPRDGGAREHSSPPRAAHDMTDLIPGALIPENAAAGRGGG